MIEANIPDMVSIADMMVWGNTITDGLLGWSILLLLFIVGYRFHEIEGFYPAVRFGLTLALVVATLLMPIGVTTFDQSLTLATLLGASVIVQRLL